MAMLTPGRLSSWTRWAQSGSGRRRVPTRAPARANSLSSRAASVRSSGRGQASPAALARWMASRTVERAAPTIRPISRSLVLLAWSRSTCRICRMVISLFAGIASSLVERSQCPNRMTRCSRVLQSDPWTGSNRKDGRLQRGRVDGIKSEPGTTSSRYTWTNCVGIRNLLHLHLDRHGIADRLAILCAVAEEVVAAPVGVGLVGERSIRVQDYVAVARLPEQLGGDRVPSEP